MTKYTINCIDSDCPYAWMSLPHTLVTETGPQDSGRCRFEVETSEPAALERALDADDLVIEYDVVEPYDQD